MTRLTKKGVTPVDAIQNSTDIANMYHVYNKLSQLEDIEESIGVDLVKLLTAGTIFTIDKDYGVFYHIAIENGGVYTSKYDADDEFYYDADDEFYPFSDYGRTWAFTRQELEKS